MLLQRDGARVAISARGCDRLDESGPGTCMVERWRNQVDQRCAAGGTC